MSDESIKQQSNATPGRAFGTHIALAMLVSLATANLSHAQFTADDIVTEAQTHVSDLTDKDGNSVLDTNATLVLKFRVMFVTEGTIQGKYSDINTYNNFANTQADTTDSIFGGAADASLLDADQWDWKAVLSNDDGTRAEVNSDTEYDASASYAPGDITSDMITPVFNTTSGLVAANYKQLWDEPLEGIAKTQELNDSSQFVWTGTDKLPVGNASATANAVGSGGTFVTVGDPNTVGDFWNESTKNRNNSRPILAISPLLHVVNVNGDYKIQLASAPLPNGTVPEPGMLLVFLAGLGVVLCWRRTRDEDASLAAV